MKRLNFNDNWYVYAASSEVEALESTTNQEFKKIKLPYDPMIHQFRDARNPSGNSGGFFPGNDWFFTKTFFVDQDVSAYYIEFEGIYDTGSVFVNGCFVGVSHYGYTRLILDISPYLIRGTDNTILVKTYNKNQPNSRWYTGEGLYRPVNAYIGGATHFAVDGIRVMVSDIEKNLARLSVKVNIHSGFRVYQKIKLRISVYGEDGEKVHVLESPVTLEGSKDQEIVLRIYLKNPKFWCPQNPILYNIRAEIIKSGNVLDMIECETGIREILIDPVHGMRINGEGILLRGACIHHDNGILGAEEYDHAQEWRVQKLKEAGFNAVRMSHQPASKALLKACDHLGMLVLDETFDTWNISKTTHDFALKFADHWEEVLDDLISKDYNHPSVFMYSIGNELQDLSLPSGGSWSRQLVAHLKQLDSQRFVTNGINGLTAVKDAMPLIMKDFDILTADQYEKVKMGGLRRLEMTSMML